MLRFGVHVWLLSLLCAGTFSDEDIDGCEQQLCHNGGVCESHSGGFTCLCSQRSQSGRLYGGETCEVALLGCDDRQCENGGICSPLLVDGQHTHTCLCPAGFTGPECETSTVFSFESQGYMHIETQLRDPEAPINVTFSFRTVRAVGTLLSRRVDDLLLSIELSGGHLCLHSRRRQGSSTLLQELPDYVSNNKWHTVEASLGGTASLIKLLCTDGGCSMNTGAEARLLGNASAALPQAGTVHQSLFIGAAKVNWSFGGAAADEADEADEADDPSIFIGCFRDVFVDSRPVVPDTAAEASDARVNVTVGCSDKDACDDGPCQNRGRCVSQGWRSYTCECLRPYEGTNCAEEYITARFGHQDLQSYAVFSLDDDPGDAVTISMFVRTRQSNGLLLILANGTSQYLRLWLEEGRVRVQVHGSETLAGRPALADSHFHLVSVKLEGTAAILFQSAQSQGSVAIRPIRARSGDLVYVGGLPDPAASASLGGYFKGCVQDLRINGKRLQFYPITTPVESHNLEQLINVTQGCSSDDVCAVNPCLNAGVCYSMWDDFVCNCPPNTAGQRCEEVKWCELSPCPAAAVCQPRPQGFECLSNVTFRAESEVLLYRGDGRIQRPLSSVSLSFRTRQNSATMLHARKGLEHLTVSLQDSRVLLEHQASVGSDSFKMTLQSRGSVGDGEWHSLELRVENQTSRWTMSVDGGEEELSKPAAADLDFLREGADIFLGGLSLDARVSMSGCLGPVEIGGLFLPFHLDTELNLPRPQEEQFARVRTNAAPQYGCWGANVCAPNPCQNRGACEDLFDLHRCSCPSGWTGPLCQDPADPCASSPCIYGDCIGLHEGFTCVCELGYGGEQCQIEIDSCEDNNCSSKSTCLKGLESYACLCLPNMTGQYCDEKIPEIPWYIETNPLPRLPASPCVGTRWNYSCFNGGNCSTTDACYCLPGFTGQWCERDVDECLSDPCMHGGFCLNYINSYECVCDVNHSGVHCQMDVSDFYLYLFLTVWQNVFQLVSYMLIRSDDIDPDIDWIFYPDE